MNIVHRGLDGGAFIINPNTMKPKIISYGNSVGSNNRKTGVVITTSPFNAPELLKNDFTYSEKVDSWSLGC